MEDLRLRLLGYLASAWHYRWHGLAAAASICAIGWLTIALIPNSFESETKVYIDTDTLLRPLLKGLAVTTNSAQQVNVMLRTLLTTPNLERVIRATNHNSDKMSGAQMQDAVASLRNGISLSSLGTKKLFSITYRAASPARAQSVAQALLYVLIDSNIGNLRKSSDNVRGFLDNQISSYEQKLTEADRRRANFKSSHLNFFTTSSRGGVTDVGDSVVAADTALIQAKTTLGEAKARRDSLVSQLRLTQSTLDVNTPPAVIIGGGPLSLSEQLSIAKAKLSALQIRFTNDYPDVQIEKHLIKKLKSEIAESSKSGTVRDLQGISNPAYVAISNKVADQDANVAVARERLASAKTQLVQAKKTALLAITVQRQYQNLDRDYQVLHKNYEALVARRESANISQAADSQQSTIFRIVEPPNRPDRPIAPNRLLLNAIVLFVGLGAGLAVAVALGETSGRIKSVGELSASFSLPVLGAITFVQTAVDATRQRRSALHFALGVSLLLLGYIVILILFHHLVATPEVHSI